MLSCVLVCDSNLLPLMVASQWDNIDDGSYEVRARFILSWAATFGLIIVFGIPVLAIQSLGNLSKLCIDVTWLAWVCKAPTVATGLLQGAGAGIRSNSRSLIQRCRCAAAATHGHFVPPRSLPSSRQAFRWLLKLVCLLSPS